MERFEDQLYIALEAEDRDHPEKWLTAMSSQIPATEEEEAWGTFAYFKRRMQKGQRVRLLWRHVRYSPPSPRMKQIALNMAKNSNAANKNKNIKIDVTVGETMRVLDSELIIEEYPDEETPSIDPIRGMF